ncbi:MAG TPA: 1,4-alpha-glucan branching protein GlgB [Candidatus Acidoferrales bacterium]|nr:1,4-alpha-glucan branching protein GlgB [Candidatus Acidoferrales bacterium]
MSPENTLTSPQLLTENDLYLFNEGSHYRIYDKMGAHLASHDGQPGAIFSVWAPNARSVSVVGGFNGWDPKTHYLNSRGSSGIWEGFIPGATHGALYKFHIESQHHGYRIDKTDPVGFWNEKPPRTASVVWDLGYQWSDQDWMQKRAERNSLRAPQAIYEVHLGSWMRVPEEHNRPLSYRETAPRLAEYVGQMGFTHVEFLPVMEHPFFGSWGYQTTGYFAPTARYGTPQDFMYLVDYLHQHGIGVILDWVPSHFPSDGHGLAYFDGTHLYEHSDSRQGFHPDWKTHIFNYGRAEVRSFLMSSAMFWFDKYHVDGLRVDAVASMLYLDYSRKQGEWIPNKFGGRENLEAIDFLRRFNQEAYKEHPDIQTTAEESTSWPMVSKPVYLGGLGFGMKWDMGWMHDTLKYFQSDPIHRKYHHNLLTFRMLYSWHENFVLPLSHDEVVHGKGSLIGKMPGDEWQRFANLRLLFGYMYAQAGKKLLFMGDEFGQVREWAHDSSLEWHVLKYQVHRGVQAWMEQLNRFYRNEPAMHVLDNDPAGFEWIDANDNATSAISLLRKSESPRDTIAVVCNFTPVPRLGYRVGVPHGGYWREMLNSDAREYAGSGMGNLGGVHAEEIPMHGRPFSLKLILPPLSALFFKAA